jgi:RND family efflux transporter MFP subunit
MSLRQKIKDFRDRRPGAFQATVVAAMLALAVLIFAGMIATREEVVRQTMTLPAPRVSVSPAEVGPTRVRITGEGTVSPLREIDLIPQVGGRVIFMSPALVDGGMFSKGDVLLRIEPVDYELAVQSALARVKDLESKLLLTEEEAEAAREEWKIQTGDDGTSPPPLVAKEPQLAAARAALEGARADLDKARLNLERTSLKAPFDGRISSKSVDLGQFVAAGQRLAAMFSVEAAEIMVPLEDSDLRWIDVPGFTAGKETESDAVVRATVAGQEIVRKARLMRTEGRLDERTRMVNVIVRVDRPYDERPPLVMGLFVRVEIEGVVLPDAVWLPRSAVHGDDTVYIVDDEDRIRFRKVGIARYDRDEVLVSSGLDTGDMVVTSPMKIVTEGMKVTYSVPEEVAGE